MTTLLVKNFLLAFGISIFVSIVIAVKNASKPEYRFGFTDIKHSLFLSLALAIIFTVIDLLFDFWHHI